jgi:predicted DCC family thiol-disulfide oxidoreductase YuxK
MAHPIVLYDGVCGLCNRFVQFILRHDRKKVFRFASLQSGFAVRILASHGVNPGVLDTVYVVLDSDTLDSESKSERLISRSDAVLFVLQQLGTLWRFAASVATLVPRFLRDAAYNSVARYRYRIFGCSEACTLPCDQDHSRFLDI